MRRKKRSQPVQVDLEEAIADQKSAAASKALKPVVDVEWLSPVDLCTMLNLSRSTIDRMTQKNQIPGKVRLLGQLRYNRAMVNAWLQSLMSGEVEKSTSGKVSK